MKILMIFFFVFSWTFSSFGIECSRDEVLRHRHRSNSVRPTPEIPPQLPPGVTAIEVGNRSFFLQGNTLYGRLEDGRLRDKALFGDEEGNVYSRHSTDGSFHNIIVGPKVDRILSLGGKLFALGNDSLYVYWPRIREANLVDGDLFRHTGVTEIRSLDESEGKMMALSGNIDIEQFNTRLDLGGLNRSFDRIFRVNDQNILFSLRDGSTWKVFPSMYLKMKTHFMPP